MRLISGWTCWYGAAVHRRFPIFYWRVAATIALLVSTFALAACGGDRQDEDEPSGTWKVAVEQFDFPATQRLGTKYRLKMRVRNLSDTTLPNLTITFDGLDDVTTQPDAADPLRPRWVRDRPKPGSVTANRNTYAVGPVEPGAVGEFWMDLTPVRRGRTLLKYAIEAGLYGKARATYEDGTPATGQREIAVDPSIDIEEDTLN
jgi:hypothetical protein